MTRIEEGQTKYIVSSTSPSGYAQRTVDTPWVDTPMKDREIAREAVLSERERVIDHREHQARIATSNPGFKAGAIVIRADVNKRVGERLGLSADELADNLARPDMNQGTRVRLPDDEFDTLMKDDLHIDPQEARRRFTGEFWKASIP